MSRSARICSPCSEQGSVGLDVEFRALSVLPWPCGAHPSSGAGTGWDHSTGPTEDIEEEGGTADVEPGQEQMESSVQLICQVTDGLQAGQGGKQGQCWQPTTAGTLPSFSLICLRMPLYSPHHTQLHRGCGACRRAGDHRALKSPSPSPGHDKILLTQEPKLREMKQPQKINLFSILFSIFLTLFSLPGILHTFSGTGG